MFAFFFKIKPFKPFQTVMLIILGPVVIVVLGRKTGSGGKGEGEVGGLGGGGQRVGV